MRVLTTVGTWAADDPPTRAEIAKSLEVSVPQAGKLVQLLVSAGLLNESKRPDAERPGPKRRDLSVASKAAFSVGVDISRKTVRVVVTDLSFTVLALKTAPAPDDIDENASGTIALTADLVAEALETAGVDLERVAGIGISISGPYDPETDISLAREVLPAWVDRPPAAELEQAINAKLPPLPRRARRKLHVRAANDASLGVLAEHWLGAARGFENVVYVRVTTGIGGGLVLNNQLYESHNGIAGELGHTPVFAEGPICSRCGAHPCLESVASVRRIQRLVQSAETVRFGNKVPSIEAIIRAAEDHGDPSCKTALWDAGYHIGVVLATVCNLLNPQRIVIGGDMRHASPDGDFFRSLEHAIHRHVLPIIWRNATAPEVPRFVVPGERDGTLDGAVIRGFEGLTPVLNRAIHSARGRSVAKNSAPG
jgi:predicted NBD/HSP70 family sugar kinase